MRTTRITMTALAAAGLLSTSAMAQATGGQSQERNQRDTAAQTADSQRQSAGQQQQDQAPEGWVLVQERIVVLTANQPQSHFLRAHQLLQENNVKAAAGELRMGAAYLEMQASRGKGQDRSQLTQSAEKLRQLAGKIESQQQGDQQQEKLKQTLANANHELAKHLHSLAQREIQNEKAIMAGYDLNAAVDSLAAAFVWSGEQPTQEATTAIQQAQTLAMQLMTPNPSQQQGQQGQQGQQAQRDQQGQQDQDPSDRAQTAGAQLDQQGGPIPQNASQTVEQLGQAIQQAGSKFQSGGESSGQSGGQSGNRSQQ